MPHVRTQIRAAVKAVLETALPSHRCFQGRRYKINAVELPMVDMRFLNENSDYEGMGDVMDHDASLYIRVARQGSDDDIDDLLDADGVAVEEALRGNRLGGLVKDCVLKQTNFTDDADGDKPIADMVLRFDITYRTSDADVQTARD